MSFCLNPHCPSPHNPDEGRFCAGCGQKLVLRDRYRAVKLIGQGGFGRTFQAIDEDKPSKPFCAIKQFYPLFDDRAALDKAAELFKQEAIALEGLDDRHIPKLLAYFVTEDGSRYLVQEYIDGQNLRAELASSGAMSVDEVKILQIPRDRYQTATEVIDDLATYFTLPPVTIPVVNRVPHLTNSISAPIANKLNCTYTYNWHRKPIDAIDISTDGQYLISGDESGTVALWNLALEQPIATYCTHHPTWAVAMSHDRSQIASGDKNRRIQLRRAEAVMTSMRELHADYRSMDSHNGFVCALAFSPDGKILASGGSDRQIRLWDSDRSTLITTLTGHQQAVTAIKFLPPGQILVSTGADRTLRFWDVASRQLLKTIESHTDKIYDLAVGGGGKIIVTGSSDRTVRVRQLGTTDDRILSGHQETVLAVAITPDGKYIASGCLDGQIWLWDGLTGQLINRIAAHESAIRSMVFAADNRTLITASWDRAIKVWKLGG